MKANDLTKKQANEQARLLAKELGKEWRWTVLKTGRFWTPCATHGPMFVKKSFKESSYYGSITDNLEEHRYFASPPRRTARAAAKFALADLKQRLRRVETTRRKLLGLIVTSEPTVKDLYKRKK